MLKGPLNLFSPLFVFLPAPAVPSSLCLKERNPLSVASVTNAHGTTQPWLSTCGLTVGPRPTSVQCARSSAIAWSPCRDTSRTMQCKISLQAGASTVPTCTSHTSEPALTTHKVLTALPLIWVVTVFPHHLSAGFIHKDKSCIMFRGSNIYSWQAQFWNQLISI